MVEKYNYLVELDKLEMLTLGVKLGVISPTSLMAKKFYEFFIEDYKKTGSKMQSYTNGSTRFGIHESYFRNIVNGYLK